MKLLLSLNILLISVGIIYLRRIAMTIQNLITKAQDVEKSVDDGLAKVSTAISNFQTALTDALANAANPAELQQIGDILDSAKAKIDIAAGSLPTV